MRAIELLNDHPKADEFDFVRTERTLYEVVPKGVNKGGALPRLAAALGIEMSKVVAIGDYHNDIAMLRAAGVGVAVANAVDEIKAVADYITVSNEEHAIARVIEELDRGILLQ
ncbi:MAG: HAD hydrolase family protein [Clostridia bacterium]|nr:HAD hydrolase family protein [Clostridia bacterium]